MLRRVTESLRKPIPSYIILINGLMLFMWGLWFLLPFDTFGFSNLYWQMAEFAPEWAWGLLAVVAGTIKIFGALRGDCKAIKIASMTGFLMWGLIAACYWSVTYVSGTPLLITFLALQAASHYLNAALSEGE